MLGFFGDWFDVVWGCHYFALFLLFFVCLLVLVCVLFKSLF